MSWLDDLEEFYGGLQHWAVRRYTSGRTPNFHSISETAKSAHLNDAQLRYYAQSVPVFGDLARFYDNNKMAMDYMRNRGLSWDDILYPTKLPSGSVGSSIGTIDKNLDAIARLYEQDNGSNELARNSDPLWSEYGRSRFKKW